MRTRRLTREDELIMARAYRAMLHPLCTPQERLEADRVIRAACGAVALHMLPDQPIVVH